jgi:hypothetical protein
MPKIDDADDVERTEEEALLLELFKEMSEEDQVAVFKVALYLAARTDKEPLTQEIVNALIESAKRIQ